MSEREESKLATGSYTLSSSTVFTTTTVIGPWTPLSPTTSLIQLQPAFGKNNSAFYPTLGLTSYDVEIDMRISIRFTGKAGTVDFNAISLRGGLKRSVVKLQSFAIPGTFNISTTLTSFLKTGESVAFELSSSPSLSVSANTELPLVITFLG